MDLPENFLPCVAILRQNRPVSTFEEYLNRGQWLAESERLAIYKYLLRSRIDKYKKDSDLLLKNKSHKSGLANGEISYSIHENVVECSIRKIGDDNWHEQVRTLKTSLIKPLLRRRLHKFFAQAELDALRNFPLQGKIPIEERGFTKNLYPFYTLNYYSSGSGKVRGLLKKIATEDDPLLEKLLTS